MAKIANNLTIALANYEGLQSKITKDDIFVVEAKNELYPLLASPRTSIWFWMSFCVVWFCVLTVCYFRYILYDYLFEQYKLKELKPINTLTFLAAGIDHLSTTIMIIYGSIMILSGDQLQYLIGGRWMCITFMYIIRFGKGYSFIGGLMISIYRIILITDFGEWMKYRLGLKNIYRIILFIGISLAVSSTFLESCNDYEKLRRDTCQLVNRMPIMIVLDEYEQSLGNPSIFSFWITSMLAISYSRICMVVLEVIIYFVFFYHMYRHDNNEMLRRLLDPNVTRHRNRTNAITFVGQFCSFSIELVWVILYIMTIPKDNNTKGGKLIILRFIVRIISFTCIPIIEVITSKILRARIYRFSLYDFIFGLS